MNRMLLSVCIGGLLSACIPDGELKSRNTAVPEALDDGLEIALPSAVGISPDALATAHDMLLSKNAFYNALALLVLRHDRLVFETYTRSPADRDRLHHMQSSTKSFSSLVFGILRGDGYFPNLDATAASLYPEPFEKTPDKKDITLNHLLTMRSGIAFDNDDFSVEMYVDGPSDPLAYILRKPMYAAAGERFYYRDTDPHLISILTGHVTGKSVEDWAEERLFAPLGITEHFWGADEGGNSMGAHGLYLKPRDQVKIGRLILHRGVEDDTPIVPADWLDLATKPQVDPGMASLEYGYYFWRVPTLNGISTWGHGGNFIFAAPDQDVVIVLVSLPDTDDDTVGTTMFEFLPLAQMILDGCDLAT